MLSLLSAPVSFAGAAAPSLQPAVRASSPSMGLEGEIGATGPLLPYWDPLGLVRSRHTHRAVPLQ